jgi:hypothetical protein
MLVRAQALTVLLLLAGAAPGLGQDDPGFGRARIRANEITVDIGVLQGGLTYAHRIGRGPLSIGGGVWAAYEPWSSFEENVYDVAGGVLLLRLHAHEMAHLEIGPTILRYSREDDCSGCGATFLGGHGAVMFGKGTFWIGPTARVGRLSGGADDGQVGILWGVQGRLLFSWGD